MSNNHLQHTLNLLNNKEVGELIRSGVELPKNIRQADVEMRTESGASVMKLDGCTKCQHVWCETDKGTLCPTCGNSRHDASVRPLNHSHAMGCLLVIYSKLN